MAGSNVQQVIPTDLYVRGKFQSDSIDLPDASVGDSTFDIGDPLSAVKQEHQYLRSQSQAGTAANENRVVHHAYAAGVLRQVQATVLTAALGAATVTIDIRKNGTSVLSAAFVVTNALAARGTLLATLNTALTTYAANDVFDATLVASAGGGTLPAGVAVTLLFREQAGA